MEKHPSEIKPESWLVSAGRRPRRGYWPSVANTTAGFCCMQ